MENRVSYFTKMKRFFCQNIDFLQSFYKYYNICTKRFIYVKIPDLICLKLKVDEIA